jgi:hypothetical protein
MGYSRLICMQWNKLDTEGSVSILSWGHGKGHGYWNYIILYLSYIYMFKFLFTFTEMIIYYQGYCILKPWGWGSGQLGKLSHMRSWVFLRKAPSDKLCIKLSVPFDINITITKSLPSTHYELLLFQCATIPYDTSILLDHMPHIQNLLSLKFWSGITDIFFCSN